jgi:hypothetical protein
MNADSRWLPLSACNILLLALAAMVNDGLAPWNISVFLAGPCMVWAGLRLGSGGLIICILISGLAGEAAWPAPPGFLVTLFALGSAAVITTRPWIGRTGRSFQVILAWLLNAAYFAAFTAWAALHGATAAFWERAAVDLCLSQLFVLPVALWFFAFQESVLRFAGFPVMQDPATSP